MQHQISAFCIKNSELKRHAFVAVLQFMDHMFSDTLSCDCLSAIEFRALGYSGRDKLPFNKPKPQNRSKVRGCPMIIIIIIIILIIIITAWLILMTVAVSIAGVFTSTRLFSPLHAP